MTEDGVASFVKYLTEKIKLEGKAGALGDKVKVSASGSTVSITTSVEVPKRYMKYLTKRYLKKSKLRDYLRVISTGKDAYELRYFNIKPDDAAE